MLIDLPSGEWSGTYEQYGSRHPQRMRLEFADGVVRGDGIDALSPFRLEGEYRVDESGEVRIGWIKTYDRSHSILYLGTIDAEGSITGTWRIQESWSGAFALTAEGKDTR
jgi:hypothetical protein